MGLDQLEGSIHARKKLVDVHEPIPFQVREEAVGMEEDWIASTSREGDFQKVMDLPGGCAKMTDDEDYLANALLQSEIAEVEAAVEGTEEGKNAGGIRAKTHLGEDN
jgi:hypothetical protein